MGFFDKLKESLEKTKKAIVFEYSKQLDDDFYDELEERLVMADAGMETAVDITGRLREAVSQKLILDPGEAITELQSICADYLRADREFDLGGSPAVILLIGVNGAGKTTTAGKLAAYYKAKGNSVLLAAADTFRAAATEQLSEWARRCGCPIVTGASDPSAVIYDAVSSAKAKGVDIVICDTAGRLHTKKNLMDELSKMSRIIKKAAPDASVESLIVLDAVTGQNAINQASEFASAAGVTGIVLTKLDGTAKGGAVLSVKRTLGIPVRFVGVGEHTEDIAEFDADEFARALLS